MGIRIATICYCICSRMAHEWKYIVYYISHLEKVQGSWLFLFLLLLSEDIQNATHFLEINWKITLQWITSLRVQRTTIHFLVRIPFYFVRFRWPRKLSSAFYDKRIMARINYARRNREMGFWCVHATKDSIITDRNIDYYLRQWYYILRLIGGCRDRGSVVHALTFTIYLFVWLAGERTRASQIDSEQSRQSVSQ